MAVTRGCFGIIKAGATPDVIAQLNAWSFDETAEEIDSSVMGSCVKSSEAGAVKSSGTMNAFWDTADTGQATLAVGAKVDVEIYPGGDGSGKIYYTGNVTILSVSRSASVDGLTVAEFGWSANGAMTESTVP